MPFLAHPRTGKPIPYLSPGQVHPVGSGAEAIAKFNPDFKRTVFGPQTVSDHESRRVVNHTLYEWELKDKPPVSQFQTALHDAVARVQNAQNERLTELYKKSYADNPPKVVHYTRVEQVFAEDSDGKQKPVFVLKVYTRFAHGNADPAELEELAKEFHDGVMQTVDGHPMLLVNKPKD